MGKYVKTGFRGNDLVESQTLSLFLSRHQSFESEVIYVVKELILAYTNHMPSAKFLIFTTIFGTWFGSYAQNAFSQETTHYKIIAADGEVLGQSESTTRPMPDGGYEVISRREYLFREREGSKRKIVNEKILSRTSTGQVSSILNNYSVGSSQSQTQAIIEGQVATIKRQIKNDIRNIVLTLPEDLQFDNGAELVKNSKRNSDDEITFHVLDIDAPAINRITFQELESSDANGQRNLLRKTYRDDTLYGISKLTLGKSGKLLKTQQDFFGTSIKRQRIEDGESASKLSPSSLVQRILVKSPVRIPRSARNGKIRYSFKFPEEISFSPPQTGEQKVMLNAEGFTLDICKGCGGGLPTNPSYLSNASQPGFWLQSDHKKILHFSKNINRKTISDSEKMRRIASKAKNYMDEIDFAGHFSALEALQKRSGDCTESAVLLAALGRSMGIPTKVASGIVYSRDQYHGVSHSFMPHAWTLAYVDGSWQSFDMALDEFDSTHIAFNISDGDPASIAAGHHLAGLLAWDGISEVRSRDRE